MKKTTIIALLSEKESVHNPHNLLSKFFVEKSRAVWVAYHPSGHLSSSHTRVSSPFFKVEPDGHFRDAGSKSFTGKRDVSFEPAKAWAEKKYGITDWEPAFDALVPAEVWAKAVAHIETIYKDYVEPKNSGLKTWSVNPKHLDDGASWDSAVVVAFSQKDAVQLYVDAGGGEHGASNYFNNYAGLGGSGFSAAIPNPSRGIYFGDRRWNSRMFIEPKSRPIVEEASAEAQAEAASQSVPEDYGVIEPGFTRATKIDEWKFRSPFADKAWADRMVAQVRMRKSDRRGRLVDHTGIEFVATSDCWLGELVHADISKLLVIVRREFVLYDVTKRGIVWEDWIEVEISPKDYGSREDERRREEGISIEYKIIKRGVDPRDQKAYTLAEDGDQVMPFPLPKAAGEDDRNPRTGKKIAEDSAHRMDGGYYHAREKRHQYAYIPATVENLAALNDLCERMVELRRRLAAVLVQKEIAKSLSGVASRLLSFKPEEQ